MRAGAGRRWALSWSVVAAAALVGCGSAGDVEGLLPEEAGAVVAPENRTGSCGAGGEGGVSFGGMNIVGGDIVVTPCAAKPKTPGWGLGQNGRHVLFMNFDGVDVRPNSGPGNALENEGLRNMDLFSKGVIELPPFGSDEAKRQEQILAIQKRVAGWYADINVDIVISRPLSGDYLMTVVGGKQSDIVQMAGVVGISPGDCKNATEANLNYAFSGSLNENPDQTAVTIAHEAGHAYGLGHTQNNRDIMFPSVTPAEGFLKGLAADPGPCGFMMGDSQDSKQVLIENLGARQGRKAGQDAPPELKILSPADGASISNEVTLAVAASSPQQIDHVTLALSRIDGGRAKGGHPVAELRPPSSSTIVKITSAGSYQLTATAYDLLGNLTQKQVQFTAGTPTCRVANDCAPGQRCTNNTCMTAPLPDKPPAGMAAESILRDYGLSCEKSSECKGGLCAVTPIGQICTHYCNSERICAGGLECVDGICEPQIVPRTTPKVGQLGGKCTRNQDCATGECSPATEANLPRYCTRVCEPEVAWSCPATMACVNSDGAGGMKPRCIARATTEERGGDAPIGGCEVASPSSLGGERSRAAALLFSVVFLLGLGLRSLRRKQGVGI